MIRTYFVAVALLLPTGAATSLPIVVEAPSDAPAWDSPSSTPVTATNTKVPFVGDLCIRVLVVGGVNLVRRDPTLPDGHPLLDRTGRRHAWVFAGSVDGVSVVDTRPDAPGWAVSGSLSKGVDERAGWSPALVASGSDPEGAVAVGPAVPVAVDPSAPAPERAVASGTPSSSGLAGRGAPLATAGPGNGLGTQRLAASVELWQPDTVASESDRHTLTITLVSP
jgi:hypothetical protein